ncbi:hypothetical protein LTR36_009110 [Oleoguttula mirabilis]|uniref:Uncharacterized protein n=1 Tax=Oleoguttula mirabilis TaxID=1507867 RepID=A0AAV9J6E8_9PEZI|nr:hypothetical protein LTR36_009110 [Oleoguttula mirabilis]
MATSRYRQNFVSFADQDAAAQQALEKAGAAALAAAMAANSLCNSKRSPLLDIPGELRNRIYRLAVISDTTVNVDSTELWGPGGTLSQTPALMRTCKQLREEVHEIYLEENSFAFTHLTIHPNAIAAFERIAGASARKMTRVKVVHAVAMCSIWELHFSAKLVPSKGGEGGVVKLYNSNGDEVADDCRVLGDTGGHCCCNVLHIERRYKDPVGKTMLSSGVLMAFLIDYARSAQDRRYGGPHRWSVNRSVHCRVCDRAYSVSQ